MEYSTSLIVNEYLKSYKSEIKHLMLGVTEKCNLRCKYCVYGGHYKNERTHSEKVMSFETAKNAVDWFMKYSQKDLKIFNFYGGEPLSNFKLIKKISEYISSVADNYQLFITSNGTLLTDEVIDWIIENEEVVMYISIAGIPEIHDRLRVFKNTEKGSFEIIKNNVLRIKEKSIDTFSKRINFVFNIFDERQLFAIRDLWNNDEMFEGLENLPEITFIDCVEDDGEVQKLYDSETALLDNVNPLDEYISLLEKNIKNDIIVKFYDERLVFVKNRETKCLENYIGGVCRPFIHKLFVDVDGNIHPCENFIYDNKFGNVNTKSDLDNIKDMLITYLNGRTSVCSNCWASKLCTLCYKDLIDKDGNIDYSRAKNICENERAKIEKDLVDYCTVLEKDDSLLDHLNEIILHE